MTVRFQFEDMNLYFDLIFYWILLFPILGILMC